MSPIREAILAYKKRGANKGEDALRVLMETTWVHESFFNNILEGRKMKYRKSNLDVVYAFFDMERDDWYHDNLKKWVKPTESILGEIFRKKRLQLGLSMQEIDRKIHVGVRQIARIEAGDSLPGITSYTIIKLVELYGFTEQESVTIRWFITLLRDMVNINNTLE